MLVRYLSNDPPAMADASATVIEDEDDLLITDVVLAETAFVLTTYYSMPRADVVDDLIDLLRRENVQASGIGTDLACEALLLCRPSGRVSFADALLWAAARGAQLPVYTMDQRFPTDGITVQQY